ncbi:S8/S53 family peptidase [Streptomyces sp. NPDC059866]|uniref:S8/S53 family peptidase n=1 Tax=Streptomyces sp. NPDC059866 TaxID=3346978 RepID=UPI003651ADF1
MAPQRFREQFDQIQRSMPDVPLAMGPDDSAEFLYEKGVVIARDGEEARLVEDTVRAHFTETTGLVGESVRRASSETNRSGITRIQVGDPGQGDQRGDRAVASALRALSAAEGRAGHRLVSRNHVVHIAPVNACPGDEPVPAPPSEQPNPAAAEAMHDPDTAVGVLVIDTGLMKDYRSYPLLAHTQGDAQIKETDDNGILQQYVGHGTFIAGLVAAVAPNTDLTVRNTLNDAGAILESEFGDKLFEAVDRSGWPDILSLSAGTPNGRTDGLLGVQAFMEELRTQRTLLVAAAGNNGSATPFWPAAYADLPGYENSVLSVGALRSDGEFGACFSNHGPWVKVYAPGERLTSSLTGFDAPVPYVYQHSTYEACRYGFSYACTCQNPRHTGVLSEEQGTTASKPDQVMFEGFAQWSGTSFATPVVAGMIASHMVAHKERDPRAAGQQLLAAITEFASVRGDRVPALRPPTWRPVPVVTLTPGA